MSSIFSGAVVEPLTLFTIHAPPDRSYGPENPVPQTFRLRSAGIVQSERSDGAKPDDRAASALHRIDIGRDLDAPELGPGMQPAEKLLQQPLGLGRRAPALDFQQETNQEAAPDTVHGGASGPSSRRPNTSRAEPANAPAARHSSSLSRCRITTAIRRQ